jgi:hypothetical protein
MGAGVKGDPLVLRQAFRRKNFHAVKISERRHGADLAIGENAFKFLFARQLDFFAPAAFFKAPRFTFEDTGKTAMAILPSILTMTVLANSFPGLWAEAAIS